MYWVSGKYAFNVYGPIIYICYNICNIVVMKILVVKNLRLRINYAYIIIICIEKFIARLKIPIFCFASRLALRQRF